MIKVRLHGESVEIERFTALLRDLEKKSDIRILSESEFYKDRGKSVYGRIYLDVESIK